MEGSKLPPRCQGCGMSCLEKIEFLSGLTDNTALALMAEAERRSARQGETLFRESEPVQAVYLIHSGSVKLMRWDGEGREQIVGIFGRGEIIWESIFLDGSLYPYTAVCVTDVDLCRIRRETLQKAVAKTEVACGVIELLSRKLHDANERNRLLATVDPESRLAGFLLYRSSHEASDTVNLRLDDIAGSICLRPETVSRKIRALEDQGLITKVGQSRIRILDRVRLMEKYEGTV